MASAARSTLERWPGLVVRRTRGAAIPVAARDRSPMIGGLESPWHLALLAVIAMLVFGPSRLPEVGKGVGRGLREFRQAIAGEDDDAERECRREQRELED